MANEKQASSADQWSCLADVVAPDIKKALQKCSAPGTFTAAALTSI
jgi:hypothetical protein